MAAPVASLVTPVSPVVSLRVEDFFPRDAYQPFVSQGFVDHGTVDGGEKVLVMIFRDTGAFSLIHSGWCVVLIWKV